ncbi:putative glycosyl transferase, group 2 family protein [Calothrix sp. NIES-4071]|nr:putative glycosyl transferase, group 2 family protein [Calothrix sp. NIES-4071]BAZ63984.1 putative glycosyl transferase, group 2 family protein [Calothrix sp. NIES-4105]
MNTLHLLLLLLCAASICFYCYAIFAARIFINSQHPIDNNYHPPITILKPICGLDTNTYENLASFCRQDYQDYQIVFSFRSEEDPGIPIVKQIIIDFPERDIKLIQCDRVIGTNLKISNLANAVVFAKHDILVLADSDIRVGSDYLQRIIQPFQDEKVGVVTCLYRSIPQGWTTLIEAVSQTTEFNAGVLVSNYIEGGIKYAFGATIVIRKQVLSAIGGFEAVADYLADDFQLGYLPFQTGYKVILSDYIVEHELKETSLADAIKQKIRWARCIRVSRFWGYLGLIFTYGIFFSSLLLAISSNSKITWIIFVSTWTTRLIMGWVVGVMLTQDSIARKYLLMIPLCDLFGFIIWCCGFLGNTIEWRGQKFQLSRDGKLLPMLVKSLSVKHLKSIDI